MRRHAEEGDGPKVLTKFVSDDEYVPCWTTCAFPLCSGCFASLRKRSEATNVSCEAEIPFQRTLNVSSVAIRGGMR